jgi:hypothetical protein
MIHSWVPNEQIPIKFCTEAQKYNGLWFQDVAKQPESSAPTEEQVHDIQAWLEVSSHELWWYVAKKMESRWDLHSQLQDQPNSNLKFYNCLKPAKPSPHLMMEIHANLNIMQSGLCLSLHPDSIF